MKIFAAAMAAAALVVTGSGCSSQTDDSETMSAPISPSMPTSKPTSPAAPDTMYDVHCIAVPAATAQRIASGAKEGVGMVPGMAEAVKSPDLENVYIVAMQFKVSGVAETQLGFWALHSSLDVNQHGRIMAVGRSAQHFTRWPHLHYPSAGIHRQVKATVGGSAACLLK